MSRRKEQAGEGKVGFIFWVLVLGLLIMVGMQVVPVKISTAQLKDHMEEMAQLQPRADSRHFRREIFKRAQDLDLPVDKKKITVDKRPNRVIMTVEMTVPIDLIVTSHNWDIRIHVDRDLFLM